MGEGFVREEVGEGLLGEGVGEGSVAGFQSQVGPGAVNHYAIPACISC